MVKKSLVSESQSTTAMIPADIGAMIDDATGTAVAVVETSTSTPYATFASARSKHWGDLSRAFLGLQEADVLLIRPKPVAPVRLAPFRFHFIAGLQYWSDTDDEGNLLAASLTHQPRGSNLKEAFESLLLVYAPDGTLEPARCTFRTTKCGAAKSAALALASAGSPEWEHLSEAHAATLVLPKPFMRFVVTVSTKQRTSRSSGYKYVAADGTAAPSMAAEVRALAEFFGEPSSKGVFQAVKEAFDVRVAEVRAAAG